MADFEEWQRWSGESSKDFFFHFALLQRILSHHFRAFFHFLPLPLLAVKRFVSILFDFCSGPLTRTLCTYDTSSSGATRGSKSSTKTYLVPFKKHEAVAMALGFRDHRQDTQVKQSDDLANLFASNFFIVANARCALLFDSILPAYGPQIGSLLLWSLLAILATPSLRQVYRLIKCRYRLHATAKLIRTARPNIRNQGARKILTTNFSHYGALLSGEISQMRFSAAFD